MLKENMKTYTATLIYTEALLKKAVFSFRWRCRTDVGFYSNLLMAIGFLISIIIAIQEKNIFSWNFVLLVIMLSCYIAMNIKTYVDHYQPVFNEFRELENGTTQFTVTDTHLSFSFRQGTSETFPWSKIFKIIKYKHYWLIIFSESHFLTPSLVSILPIDTVSPEMQAFILDRFEQEANLKKAWAGHSMSQKEFIEHAEKLIRHIKTPQDLTLARIESISGLKFEPMDIENRDYVYDVCFKRGSTAYFNLCSEYNTIKQEADNAKFFIRMSGSKKGDYLNIIKVIQSVIEELNYKESPNLYPIAREGSQYEVGEGNNQLTITVDNNSQFISIEAKEPTQAQG